MKVKEIAENCTLKIIEPSVFLDKRGYFFESFNQDRYNDLIGKINFVQDNESCSSKGVLRGLHYQAGEYAQAKLVRVIKGAVVDFALDIRKLSTTFGKLFSVLLTQENKVQFFIPRGFAHGFYTLKDNTIFSYKCDNYWNPNSERGINILNYDISNILKQQYKIQVEKNLILSEKDLCYPNITEAKDLFN